MTKKAQKARRSAQAEAVVETKKSKPVAKAPTKAEVTKEALSRNKKGKLSDAELRHLTAKKVIGAVKAAKPKLTHDPKKEGIPAFLQTQNRKPPTKAEQVRIDKATKAQRAEAIQAVKGPAATASTAAERLKQLLASKSAPKAGTSQRAPQRQGNVIPLPTGRDAAGNGVPSGSSLTVRTARVGQRVRVMGLERAGVLSRQTFVLRPFEKDEPRPGPEWFAIDDDRAVHVGDLVAA
jgi:hypothetical protein